MNNNFKTKLDFDILSKNNEIVFFYPDKNNTYLKELNTKYQLEQKVNSAKNSTEKVIIITKWVNSLWKHDGYNQPTKTDAKSILEEVEKGNNFRCTEFSIVTSACLNAIGIPTRTVSLKTKDVETRELGAGHVVIESYIQEYEKWILADPQFNIIATNKNNIPLNSFELQELITNDEQIDFISEPTLNFESLDTKEYIRWIYPYLFYADIPFDVRYDLERPKIKVKDKLKLMLVPLGEKNPTKFQKTMDIDFCIYTNSIKDYYLPPNTNHKRE
jgi:hypothetical protein